jgi:hypothetical protein
VHLLQATGGAAHASGRRKTAIALLMRGRDCGTADWDLEHVGEINSRVLPVQQLMEMEGIPGKRSPGWSRAEEGGDWWDALPIDQWLEPAQEAVGAERWVGGWVDSGSFIAGGRAQVGCQFSFRAESGPSWCCLGRSNWDTRHLWHAR